MAYKVWLEEAWLRLRQQVRCETFTVPVAIAYTVRGTVNEKRDIGNLEKPLTDFLVTAGILMDDSLKHVRRIVLEYAPDGGEGLVEVAVEEVGGMG